MTAYTELTAWARLAPGHPDRRCCPATHVDDLSPCGGPVVATVIDQWNAGVDGCEHHAAHLLASIERGRVYGLPDAPRGTAIRVFKAACDLRPFPWRAGGRCTA